MAPRTLPRSSRPTAPQAGRGASTPRLVLVPTGPDVEPGWGAAGPPRDRVSGTAGGTPGLARAAGGARSSENPARPDGRVRPGGEGVPRGPGRGRRAGTAEPPLRLTPLGRLVVGLLVALALCGVATVATSSGATAAREAVTVTVEAGQTLSGVADTYLPELSVAEGVARLQLFNGLSTSHIHVGQVLRIPDL